MTLSEFKAWFDGFTEDMAGPPSKKQWERIKSRVGEITGQAVSYPVYIDRYVTPVRPYWDRVWAYGQPYNGSLFGQAISGGSASLQGYSAMSNPNASFDSHTAMQALGKADALALAS